MPGSTVPGSTVPGWPTAAAGAALTGDEVTGAAGLAAGRLPSGAGAAAVLGRGLRLAVLVPRLLLLAPLAGRGAVPAGRGLALRAGAGPPEVDVPSAGRGLRFLGFPGTSAAALPPSPAASG